MVVPGLGASSLIASTLGIFGSGLWMIPLLLGTITYYRYDRVDPESRAIDQKNLFPEYDYIIVGEYEIDMSELINCINLSNFF